MKRERAQFGLVFILASVFLAGLVVLAGCKKKTEPVQTPTAEQKIGEVIEQTICPVMAGPINEDMFTEYKGKKVYFCCAGCKEKFEKEPEKYLSKLPQFKEELKM